MIRGKDCKVNGHHPGIHSTRLRKTMSNSFGIADNLALIRTGYFLNVSLVDTAILTCLVTLLALTGYFPISEIFLVL